MKRAIVVLPLLLTIGVGAPAVAAPAPAVTGVPVNASPDPTDTVTEPYVDEDDPAFSPRAGAVGTHNVTVRVAVDKKFADRYPGWKSKTKDIIERGDNKLQDTFGINLVVKGYVTYESSSSTSCNDRFYDLKKKVGKAGNDVVIGFSGKTFDFAGCALDDTLIMRLQRPADDWKVLRHETSHLFGAKDRYKLTKGGQLAPNPNHRDDVMENCYTDPSNWSNETPDGDYQIIKANRATFD